MKVRENLRFLICFAVLASAVAAPLSSHARLLHGVYMWEPPAGGPVLVPAYERWLGVSMDLAQGHQSRADWYNIEGPEWALKPWGEWVKGKSGRRFNYSVAMFPNAAGPDKVVGTSDDYTLAKCARGDYDHHYRTLADNLKKHGLKKSILRLGWEFSGDWMPWSAMYGKEKTFASCFRRMATVIRNRQPKMGFQFDWNPNHDIAYAMLDATYPGDDVVDYIGVDIYDMAWDPGTYQFPADCDENCKTARRQYTWDLIQQKSLDKMLKFAKKKNKPLSIPEWGATHDAYYDIGGRDNPYYIRKMWDFIHNPNNRVAYQAYFDAGDGKTVHQLSPVTGHAFSRPNRLPAAARAFRTFINPHALHVWHNIALYYRQYLCRTQFDADQALLDWVDVYKSGVPLESIRLSIEWSIEGQIKRAYRQILLRQVDAAGYSHFASLMQAGQMGINDVRLALVHSGEGRALGASYSPDRGGAACE